MSENGEIYTAAVTAWTNLTSELSQLDLFTILLLNPNPKSKFTFTVLPWCRWANFCHRTHSWTWNFLFITAVNLIIIFFIVSVPLFLFLLITMEAVSVIVISLVFVFSGPLRPSFLNCRLKYNTQPRSCQVIISSVDHLWTFLGDNTLVFFPLPSRSSVP